MPELLRYLLTFTALYEFYSLYLLWTSGDVTKPISTGFMLGETTTQGTFWMCAFVLFSLIIMRLHLVSDMTNKALYRTVLWIHLVEAALLVGLPAYNGTLVINPVSITIAITPLWMTISYKGYLYPNVGEKPLPKIPAKNK